MLTKPNETMLDVNFNFPTLRANRTAMAVLDEGETVAFLSEAGREGMFVWEAADQSGILLEVAIASSAVNSSTETITSADHTLNSGDAVISVDGNNGLTLNTLYYVIRVDKDNFRLASTYANAKAGTAFNLTATTAMSVRRHIDPAQGIYVCPPSAIGGTGGAWRRVFDGDIALEWFGAVGDWNREVSDPTATDDTAAIHAAIGYAGRVFAGGGDLGGGKGAKVRMRPHKTYMISSQIIVRDGVCLCGQGPYSSVFRIKGGFNPAHHCFILGNADQRASFGARIEDAQIFQSSETGNLGVYAIYTNNAQHTGGVARVKIFAGGRGAFCGETGFGGASVITIDDLETFHKAPVSGNVGIQLDYSGALIMSCNRLVAQGPSVTYSGDASVGCRVEGGLVRMDGYHTEGLAVGILDNIRSSSNSGLLIAEGVTGGVGMAAPIRVDGAAAAGTLSVRGIMTNGATYAVQNNRTGTNLSGNRTGEYTD